MPSLPDCDMIFSDEAIDRLVGLYRERLGGDPELMAREWFERTGQVAELLFHDDDWVLLVERE